MTTENKQMTDTRSDFARRTFFHRGFRDGAGGNAYKHEDEPDYMRGVRAGRTASANAMHGFCMVERLEFPSVLRDDTVKTVYEAADRLDEGVCSFCDGKTDGEGG